MSKFTKVLSLIAAAAVVVALPVFGQGPTWTTSTIQAYNSYDYELWNQDNKGTVSMKLTGDNGTVANAVGGTFEATWKNTQNVLFRSGRKFTGTSGTNGQTHTQIGEMSINFEATWSSGDAVKMLGVYGWAFFKSGSNPTTQENGTASTFSNQIEYYIIQDRGSYNSATSGTNSKKYGSATIDGIAYDFYVCDRLNQPMLTGNGNFKQYFSVPQSASNHRTSGTISVSKHFNEWEKVGMKMDGPLYEVAMKVESYNGSSQSDGSAKVTKNILTIGVAIPGNFTLTTTASPLGGGRVTKNPDNVSYNPNSSVTITATPASPSWKFDGWSGDATGTTSPTTVTMNANKEITANFVLIADDTTNIIKDGNFPGTSLTSNWMWNTGEYYGNSAGSNSVSGGKVTLNITTAGTESYQPQLIQQGIALNQGMKYRLTFTASAGAARSINVGFQQSSDPWGTYKQDDFSLTTIDQEYSMEFTMTEASDPNAQLSFNVGGTGTANTRVTISKVRLVYITGTTAIAPKPAVSSSVKNNVGLTVTPNNAALNISFNAKNSGKAAIKLYSLKGNLISSAKIQTTAGTNYSHTFSTANLANGFYMVKVSGKGFSEQARVSVQK